MSTILDVPHFEQSGEGYCLPACARMVLAYLGVQRTEAEIARLLGTQRFGTPNFAIVKLAAWASLSEWIISSLVRIWLQRGDVTSPTAKVFVASSCFRMV